VHQYDTVGFMSRLPTISHSKHSLSVGLGEFPVLIMAVLFIELCWHFVEIQI